MKSGRVKTYSRPLASKSGGAFALPALQLVPPLPCTKHGTVVVEVVEVVVAVVVVVVVVVVEVVVVVVLVVVVVVVIVVVVVVVSVVVSWECVLMLYSCLLRIIDSFGTEPAFNHDVYAKAHHLKTQWGMQNLNPQQFFTMFRQ